MEKNSTGAPVCVLLPFSTWAVFFAGLFYQHDLISSQFASGMDAYVHAIPYCFYPFFALLIVFLFTIGKFPKLGAMKKAFARVEKRERCTVPTVQNTITAVPCRAKSRCRMAGCGIF